MNVKKLLIASVVIWIVGTVFGMLTCGWLFSWVYELPPNIWQSHEAMMENLVWMNLLGFFGYLAFAFVFAIFYKGIPGQGIKKGVNYGILIWLAGSLVGMFTMPLYMTISTTVVIYWIVQALALNLINGAIIGKIYKEE